MKLVVIMAVVLLSGATAQAEKCTSSEGKKAWADGAKAYNLGKFDEAIERWEVAYEECASADILFNLAQANRKAGHHARARDLYKAWLREEEAIDPVERADVEKKIGELEALIAAEKQNAEGPPKDIKKDQPPAPEPTRDVAPGPYRTWKWVALAAGTVAVAGGVTLILIDEDEFTDTGARKAERFESMTGGIVLTATGAALVGTGIILWALDKPQVTERVAITPTEGGAVFVIGGSF